ncbi:hypothetical protein AXK57_21950 [Tsukamurella pulmonis]|nr:hypothetical protein AXK57_21950 [Tsukamurella pulmonis]
MRRMRADGGRPSPRHVAEQLVDAIGPGPEWTVRSFVHQLSLDQKRPIQVRQLALPNINQQITGQLWQHQHYDEILVAENVTDDERDLIVCHELAHLMLRHVARAPLAALAQQFWTVPPHLVLGRLEHIRSCSTAGADDAEPLGDYAPDDDPLRRSEAEAEWVATLLISRAADARQRIAAATRTTDANDTNKVVHRIAETFGYI